VDKLKTEITSKLENLPRRRQGCSHLIECLKSEGWKGWGDPTGFSRLCAELGFYVYKDKFRNYRPCLFIALDPKPETPDNFTVDGYVLVNSSGYLTRLRTPRSRKRYQARVWRTLQGIVAFCQRESFSAQEICPTEKAPKLLDS
jgi:hypothetical protein